MMNQDLINDLRANAEMLLNAARSLYGVSQELTANLSDKDIAQKVVAIEGYLELVTSKKRDVNKSRKAVGQELNIGAGILE